MTLPSFLIVGAMKAGTTTLFGDLASHPEVSPPDNKEPGDLNDDEVLTPQGRARYERHFRRCSAGKSTFEASTYYTMLPQHQGSPRRAHSVLGSDLKVIYIVREPIARAISHHHHGMDSGFWEPDINKVILEDNRLIDYSRYFQQIEPWLETFGREQVMVLHFESYIANRVAMVEAVQDFLGLKRRGDLVAKESVANRSQGKLLDNSLSRRLSSNPLYRNIVRPFLPTNLKHRAKQLVTRPSTSKPMRVNVGTVDLILDQTAEDVSRIAPLIHPPLDAGAVPWDVEKSRQKALGGGA
tara:strand:- start:846 stop:1736 length:891 start_codon:yes stop_codon:yes gene_type:complete